MFCTKCGSNVPEGSAFCTSCGAVMGENKVAPAEAAAPAIPAGLSKGKYLASYASPKAKKLSLVSRLGAIACVILFVVSYFTALNTSMEDLPIITNLASLADADVNELKEIKAEFAEDIEDLEDVIDDYEDNLTSEEKEVCAKVIDVSKDFAKSMSINNTKKVLKVAVSVAELDFDDAEEVARIIKGDIEDGIKEVEGTLETISGLIMWFMLIPCIFTALGGLFRIRGFVIAGLIFLVIYGLTFCPLVLLILLAVLHIALIYVTAQIRGEYKAYRAATFAK